MEYILEVLEKRIKTQLNRCLAWDNEGNRYYIADDVDRDIKLAFEDFRCVTRAKHLDKPIPKPKVKVKNQKHLKLVKLKGENND